MKKSTILRVRPGDDNHQVVTVQSEFKSYRKSPCAKCPWRLDAVGEFPAEVFRHSAETAYDMSAYQFGCHDSGARKPATCAGFLLRGSGHNLGVRLGYINGSIKNDVTDGGNALHDSYRAMAVANGVSADDPVLTACRD